MYFGAQQKMKTQKAIKSFFQKATRDHKYISSLSVATLVLVTSGIIVFSKMPGLAIEQTIVGLDQSQWVLSQENMHAVPSESIIANVKNDSGLKPFSLETAIEDVATYAQVALNGYTISIDHREIGFFKSEMDTQKVLESFKTPYVKPSVTDIYFKEQVESKFLRRLAMDFSGYSDQASAINYLKKGSEEIKTHKVVDGESFWAIAEANQISIDKLISANPNLVPERIKPGDVLNLIAPKSLLTVCTVEQLKYTENIPFDIRVKDDSKMFKGQTKVVVAGVTGKKAVEVKLISENGKLINKQILNEKVVAQASTQFVNKGIKALPSTAPTGKFAKPFSRGAFSSPFGRRWGRMHKGVDFNMPTGSSIFAADGGKVEKVSFEKDGYGLHVIINHGNGYKTVYAHTSKALVKVGDKVSKGQQIALSGSTGRSYSPHLHFEVYKNGTPVNPLGYISK